MVLILVLLFQCLFAASLQEQFEQVGYVEYCDKKHGTEIYNSLYLYFDELVEFLKANPYWKQKLYVAKERFIRSRDRNKYASDFFGLYDESNKVGRSQISFYYSIHFHEFIFINYPEFKDNEVFVRFFETCRKIQQPYGKFFDEVAGEFGLDQNLSILFKVIKYLPEYRANRPHYDGTAFSLFLDSTDNDSLLFSPYKSSFTIADFSSPVRTNNNSILLIPGTLLTELSIYPTPHIVQSSGHIRYATIGFAMRPNYLPKKSEYTALPVFKFD